MIDDATEFIKEFREVPSYLASTISGTLVFSIVYKATSSVSQALTYAIILILVFTAADYIHSKLHKEEVQFDLEAELEKLSKEIEQLKEQNKLLSEEKEKLKIQYDMVALEFLGDYNSDLPRFFKVLEEKGFLSLEELERKLVSLKKTFYFIFEWGEKPPYPKVRRTFFSQYVDELKKQGYKVFRLNTKRMNLKMVVFMFVPDESVKGNVAEFILSGYWKYLERNIKKFQDDPELMKWFFELKQRGGPIVLITHPYTRSTLKMLNSIGKWMNYNDRQELEEELVSALNQEIKTYEIKLSYLLETVEFDSEIIQKFESLEDSIVRRLMDHFGILKGTKGYFYELLNKEDFLNAFILAIQELDPQFYEQLRGDARFKRLVKLILNLQAHVFGVIDISTLKSLVSQYASR